MLFIVLAPKESKYITTEDEATMIANEYDYLVVWRAIFTSIMIAALLVGLVMALVNHVAVERHAKRIDDH